MYEQDEYPYSQNLFGDEGENEVTGQSNTYGFPSVSFSPGDSELVLSPGFLHQMQFTDSDVSIRNVLSNNDLLNASQFAELIPGSSDNGAETKYNFVSHPIDTVSAPGSRIPVGSYVMVNPNPGSNEPQSPEGMIPEIEDGLFESWGGNGINFEVTPLVDAKKALFSEAKNKVYCNTDTAVTFKVQMNFQSIQKIDDLMIRSFLAFEDNGSRNRAVLRCPIHSAEEKLVTDPINHGRLDHILRPQNPKANMIYHQSEKSKRCYLLMALKAPEPGMNFVKITLCFTCRNSCATSGSDGKAKKDIAIMFFLFNKKTGEILGRRHINVRVCSAPTRDYNKDHGISNGAASSNRKRKYNDGTEAALLPSPRQLNIGSGEVPLTSFQPSEQRLVVPIVETLQMRSTVRAAKVDDDGVSSSQETVFSFDETPERINLKRLLKDVKWVLHLKHSGDPDLVDYSTSVYGSLKLTQTLCDNAKALYARKRQEQHSETSPDGGFHDVAQD